MIKFLEKYVMPVAGKVAEQRHLQAIRDGIILTMPFLIIGSFFLIISALPIPGYNDFMAGLFGESWQKALGYPVSATFNIMSLIATFGIAYRLGEYYKVDSLASGALSLVSFLLATPFQVMYMIPNTKESVLVDGVRAFGVSATDRASQYASVGFDATVAEVWPYLVAGAGVFMIDDSARHNAAALRDWLTNNQINIGFVPTPMAEQLIQLDWPRDVALRALLTGGDRLHRYPTASLPFKLINNYGPTEGTVVATSGEVPVTGDFPEPSIGRPIDNVIVRILDEGMHTVPDGVPGEIYVGGQGLARGYVDPELTSHAFVASPYAEDGGRLYKTGDTGFYMPNGEIAFVGRNDDQIKIRGFRIEPNEIVVALNKHPAVQSSAVKAVDHFEDKKLIAYIVPAGNKSPSASDLLTFVRGFLPEYMAPTMFVRCDALPMTINGKLDRNALPDPVTSNLLRDAALDSPQTEQQRQLLSILKKLLKIEDVSLGDNFFLLGGHSLLGAQLIAEVKRSFGVELTLVDLFEDGTVIAIAERIEQLSRAKSFESEAA